MSLLPPRRSVPYTKTWRGWASGMIRGSWKTPILNEPRRESPVRLRVPCPEHVAGGQLRGPVEAAGRGDPRLPAGLAALRHRRARHAALAAQARQRARDERADPPAGLPRIVP